MIIKLDIGPFTPRKWELLWHENLGIWPSLEGLNLTSYTSSLQVDDGKITGYELLKQVRNLFPVNANLLDYFLKNQSEIPDWIKELCPLFFMSTVYRDETGRECVRCLCHNIIDGKEIFYWRWRWLSDFWRKNNPVLISKSPFFGYAE